MMMENNDLRPLGATLWSGSMSTFNVWAPFCDQVEVHIVSPDDHYLPLRKDSSGYFSGQYDVTAGTLYYYRLNGHEEFPDPSSRSQPHGVHGPSEFTGTAFPWNDSSWKGPLLEDYIIYELHTGTFTDEGTFDAVIPHLEGLARLGITAIELMPVAQFPGGRNWGYDGVYPYAVQDSYGGPAGLKRLINACHKQGIAVVLDVVYNHLGHEGNHFTAFGPYFTDKYSTPWGSALNFDEAYCDEVRRFFIDNALYWVTEFHVDALRLDALHAIVDNSALTFVEELAASIHSRAHDLGRNIFLIGESAANDSRLIREVQRGGYGLDAQWNDDYHHLLHIFLTGEHNGYYQDFGSMQQMKKAYEEGFIYSGEYSAFRKHRHGNSSRDIPADRFVVFSQNHDQVGNRARGERLTELTSFEGLKLAAGAVLLSPFIPLLFMGEEYGETAPFPYFTSHGDTRLIEATRKGRREEFAGFDWQGEIPDPQDERTFLSAKLDHQLPRCGRHNTLLGFYRKLIELRKNIPALSHLSKDTMEVRGYEQEQTITIIRNYAESMITMACNISARRVSVPFPLPCGEWKLLLDSSHLSWQGPGDGPAEQLVSTGKTCLTLQPQSFVLYVNNNETERDNV